MRPQLLGFAVGIFLLGTILSSIASGVWIQADRVGIINALAEFEDKQIGDSINPNMFITWFKAIRNVLVWDYPFLDSPWAIFIKIPLWIISIMVIWALIEFGKTIVQGLLSAVRTIIG